MKRLVLPLAALTVATGASAVQWIPFGDELHLDLHSIKTVDRAAPVVSSWFKLTGGMGKNADTPGAVESRTQVEVNCRAEKLRTRAHYRYDKRGNVLYQEQVASGWMSPPPESAGEMMMGATCGAWAKLKAGGLLRE